MTQRPTTVTTQTTTTEMTEPPPPPPPPIYPPIPTQPKSNNNKLITSEAAENAALIIGIIAAALIAIVLIILIILKFKNRPETSYKMDETKTFCQDPNAALLGAACSGQPFNGSLKNGANGSKNNKKRELIDIKEWYVEGRHRYAIGHGFRVPASCMQARTWPTRSYLSSSFVSRRWDRSKIGRSVSSSRSSICCTGSARTS